MEEMIFQTIYGIVTTAIFISIIIITVQIIKIKNKLYDKSTAVDMMFEGEIAELAGDKTEALKWYYKALFWHWNDRYEYAKFDNKFDELITELESLYGNKIKKCGGQWPDRIKNPNSKPDISKQLADLESYFNAGAFTAEEYEEEKAKLFKK